MTKNTLLSLAAFTFFAMAFVHLVRVIFALEIIVLGIDLPYAVSILIIIGLSYLGWQLLHYKD
jgi:hypothetical protein|tara:strand:+ start:340 stop:528 length:189 start_codon:yes stop_codon:yes gene_type:complete